MKDEAKIWDERRLLYLEIKRMATGLRGEGPEGISEIMKTAEEVLEDAISKEMRKGWSLKHEEVMSLLMHLESMRILREIRAIELEQLRLLKELCDLLHEKKKL
jgi:hypothetical protein